MPTTIEAGVPDFKIEIWFALFTTSGTPRETVKRLNAETNKAVALPDVNAKLKSLVPPRNARMG